MKDVFYRVVYCENPQTYPEYNKWCEAGDYLTLEEARNRALEELGYGNAVKEIRMYAVSKTYKVDVTVTEN